GGGVVFFFSSRRRHTRLVSDWSSDVCSSDLFGANRFDAVMHFAALAYVGESVTAPGRYYDVNVNGTRVLLDAMVRAGVRAIVFRSEERRVGKECRSRGWRYQ